MPGREILIEDWAPCWHGGMEDKAQQLVDNSPPLKDMIFILCIEGTLKFVGDQWMAVVYEIPDWNQDLSHLSWQESYKERDTLHCFIQADEPDVAVCQLWKLVINAGLFLEEYQPLLSRY